MSTLSQNNANNFISASNSVASVSSNFRGLARRLYVQLENNSVLFSHTYQETTRWIEIISRALDRDGQRPSSIKKGRYLPNLISTCMLQIKIVQFLHTKNKRTTSISWLSCCSILLLCKTKYSSACVVSMNCNAANGCAALAVL